MTAFFVKFVMTMAVLWIVLGLFFSISFRDILITSIVLTAIGFVGDVYLLPRTTNTLTAIADFGLAFFVVWIMGMYLFNETYLEGTVIAAFMVSLVVVVGEAFYHNYFRNQVIKNDEKHQDYARNHNLQTEFAEEFDRDLDKDIKK
ncbi:YndM family protein [Lysinibacillus sp. KU-BSD001]|uniref:YndM family protein n=1 Tax=Lysinibacillus sp. KU-BSD001 TaxID=3141328 RepID=UPI0036E7F1DF